MKPKSKKENFVLPEKWYIKGCDELGNFIPYEANVEGNDKDCYYYNPSNDYLLWNITLSFLNGFTEITFEQFKEHVLKEKYHESEFNEKPILEDTFTTRKVESKKLHLDKKTNKYREIIGYKLIKPEYKCATREILIQSNMHYWFDGYFSENLKDKGYNFGDNSKGVKIEIEKAGVMHWFEPVYKPETITLKSGVELSEADIDEVRGILIDRYEKL